jgi:O-6-methylguanine DNA methyltransferase
MGNYWYGVIVQNSQVLANDFSPGEPNLKRLIRRLPKNLRFQIVKKPNQTMQNVLIALEEAFKGKDRKSYGFTIDMSLLSSYAKKVLNCTRQVPVGYVTTYGAIAKVVGGIGRSVGRIEALNPFPLLIPCHRVVRSDLRIGGYGYGEKMKMEILQREDRGYEESKKLKINDEKLVLFPIKWIKINHNELIRVKRTAYKTRKVVSSGVNKIW